VAGRKTAADAAQSYIQNHGGGGGGAANNAMWRRRGMNTL